MKLEVGKKYAALCGEIVTIAYEQQRATANLRSVFVGTVHNGKVVGLWMADGTLSPHCKLAAVDWTLESEIKPTQVGYLNIFKQPTLYATRADADTHHLKDSRLACVRVEFVEGQFDD